MNYNNHDKSYGTIYCADISVSIRAHSDKKLHTFIHYELLHVSYVSTTELCIRENEKVPAQQNTCSIAVKDQLL